MIKLLILAYDFPPYVSVGGLRPYSWYRYFHEFDIYPIVVTRQWSNKHGNYLDYISEGESNKIIYEKSDYGEIIKTPYHPNLANRILLKYGHSKFKWIRKIISAYYEFAQFLFFVGPKAPLYFASNAYLKNNKVDAIIATGDPFILYRYASVLSKRYQTPWIADYRDIWSQGKGLKQMVLFNYWNTFFERKIVKSASSIITVSEFLKRNISKQIKNNSFYVLPNGFSPEAIEATKHIQQEKEYLQIALVGSIYSWNPISIFLKTLQVFINQKQSPKIKINFYGVNIYGFTYQSLEELIEKEFKAIRDYMYVYPRMPNDLVLAELAKQNLLLLFNHFSLMGTKIFEYIGLERSILFCFENDKEANALKKQNFNIQDIEGISTHLQADLIKETNSGFVIENSEHLLQKLNELYEEFLKLGYIECKTKGAEKFSRKNQVQELAQIINSVTLVKWKI